MKKPVRSFACLLVLFVACGVCSGSEDLVAQKVRAAIKASERFEIYKAEQNLGKERPVLTFKIQDELRAIAALFQNSSVSKYITVNDDFGYYRMVISDHSGSQICLSYDMSQFTPDGALGGVHPMVMEKKRSSKIRPMIDPENHFLTFDAAGFRKLLSLAKRRTN